MLYSRFGKRWLDLIAATSGVILLSPFLVVVAIAVRLSSPGPAFFRQIRIGQFGRKFRIFKFRSMVGEPRGRGALLTAAGDPRITTLGRWLRSTKIDELPQLFNVIVGDMSIVGPRPEVPAYVLAYDERQKTVLSVKPGISGISANVREEELMASQTDKEDYYISTIMPAKLEFDIAYSREVRFATDMKILFGAVGSVARRITEILFPPLTTAKET